MMRTGLALVVSVVACVARAPVDDKTPPFLEHQPVEWFGSKVAIVFPSKVELSAVNEELAPGMLGTPSVRVAQWKLAEEDFESGAEAETVQRWSGLLAGQADSSITSELNCVARHIARFISKHEGPPEAELRQFIASRCNSAALSLAVVVYHGQLGFGMTDDEIAAGWTAKVAKALPPSFDVVGVVLSRAEVIADKLDEATLIVVTGKTLVDRLSSTIKGPGQVSIEGRVKLDVTRLVAVSADADAVDDCTLDASVELPLFLAACPHDRVALVAFRPGGGLGTPVLQWNEGRELTYKAVRSGDGDLHEQINRKRSKAGLSLLIESESQSIEARRLAPSFFAAKSRSEREVVDVIAKGLMAGWDVRVPVTAAVFLSAATSAGADPKTLFESMWADPLVARQLLRPELRRLAVGAVRESGAVGALVVGYETVESGDRALLQQQMFEALTAARTKQGKERPVPWRDVAATLSESVEQIESGKFTVDETMERAIRVATKKTGDGAKGHFVVPTKVHEIRFPAALIAPVQIEVGLAVAIEKIPGQPWSKPVVLVLESIETWNY